MAARGPASIRCAIRRAGEFHRRPSRDRVVLVQAWILLVIADLALRILPPARVLAVPGRLLATRGSSLPPAAVTRLGWLVRVAARYVPIETTCLKEALVTACLLARAGVPTVLRIGVARRERTLTAHAWLERDGEVVFDTGAAGEYEVLR